MYLKAIPMPKGKDISTLLRPVRDVPLQAYFGQGLHTLGLLGWLLPQTGAADVWVSSYSTSEPFLNGFFLLRQKGLINHSAILLDQRAARKTLHLESLLDAAFERVYLGQNHSKLLLLQTREMTVSVITSQNQTYGARAESTIISTDIQVFDVLIQQFADICAHGAVQLDLKNGTGIITESRAAGTPAADAEPDWRPFGLEW
ncbi:MAG: C4-dicarboxylate ABC transporter [Alloprevotella sp.]|nr:C4-dicarboxylate ABC transporter [Alloprevotella sp.]